MTRLDCLHVICDMLIGCKLVLEAFFAGSTSGELVAPAVEYTRIRALATPAAIVLIVTQVGLPCELMTPPFVSAVLLTVLVIV